MKLSSMVALAVCCGACCGVAAGCGQEGPEIVLPVSTSASPARSGGAGADAAIGVAECDGRKQGTPCGPPGKRMHCIFDACVKNACGDGWPAFGEACDDGNERDGDGCSARCEMEVAPGCGNGVLEPGEECDDGNQDDADGCTADCRNPRCGDGVQSRGEECDDGNVSNGDACTSRCKIPDVLCGNGALDRNEACDDGNTADGDGCEGDCTLPPVCGNGALEGDEECDDGNTSGGDGCESDCSLPGGNGSIGSGSGGGGGMAGMGFDGGTAGGGAAGSSGTPGGDEDGGVADGDEDGGTSGPGADCAACRDANCRDYQGIDFVAGCFDPGTDGEAARSGLGVAGFSPAQVQLCVDARACAEANHCGYTPGFPADTCYCGPFHDGFGLDECNTSGPESGAPCRAEWEAATEQTTPTQVLSDISNVEVPAGWAYFILECETAYCDGQPDQSGNCTH